MDVIIPDTSAFPDPTVDERLDVFEGFDPCAAQGIRGELWTLRAEVERLTAERDAIARRMRVVEMHVVACRRSDGTYWLDYPSGRIAFVICALNDDARARGYWSSASAALDAAADALETAGLMEVER